MEEIQNNPNIPDDIKAVLSGSVLDEDVEEPAACLKDAVEAIIQEKYDDILDEIDSDEEMIRSRRGRKSKRKEDDDWFATKKERLEREKKINGPKPRGRPKRKSDDGNVSDDKSKRKKTTPKKKDESTRKSTDTPKTQSEKSKATKKPPALPFNLLDLSKKFEGKIPSLKNQSNDTEAIKKVVVELLPTIENDKIKMEKSPLSQGYTDRSSQPGIGNGLHSPPSTVTSSNANSSLKQTTAMQNGLHSQSRTTLSSTISSKDVKPCELTQSKYSLKV